MALFIGAPSPVAGFQPLPSSNSTSPFAALLIEAPQGIEEFGQFGVT
jgi:hypothetical protein